MKKILTFASLFLIYVFQTTGGQYIKIFNIMPNYALAFVIIYSISNSYMKSAFVGMMCGLLMDISSPDSLFGVSSLMIMYMALIISWVSNKFYCENNVVPFVFVIFGTIIYEFLFLLLTKAMSGNVSMLNVTFRYILPESLLNAILCLPMRFYVRWLKNEYIRGI